VSGQIHRAHNLRPALDFSEPGSLADRVRALLPLYADHPGIVAELTAALRRLMAALT
jgi:hypothetical protein